MITCTFENGNKDSLRHITVCAIVSNKNGQILLTKRALYLIGGGKYTIPGGFLDRDEDLKQGMLRELLEETGLRARDIELFRINDSPKRPKEDRQNVDFIFVINNWEGNLSDNTEVIGFEWVDSNSIPSDEDFAFDHRESIEMYFKHLKKPFFLPIIDSL